MGKFKHAKYKRGEQVNCPHGEGIIVKIILHTHKYWYQIGDTPNFYNESEIKSAK